MGHHYLEGSYPHCDNVKKTRGNGYYCNLPWGHEGNHKCHNFCEWTRSGRKVFEDEQKARRTK